MNSAKYSKATPPVVFSLPDAELVFRNCALRCVDPSDDPRHPQHIRQIVCRVGEVASPLGLGRGITLNVSKASLATSPASASLLAPDAGRQIVALGPNIGRGGPSPKCLGS